MICFLYILFSLWCETVWKLIKINKMLMSCKQMKQFSQTRLHLYKVIGETMNQALVLLSTVCNNVSLRSVGFLNQHLQIRRRFDKCLASPPEGATIAREIYYRVVHSRRRLLSKFQSNRTRSFVLTACANGRVRGF